MRIALAALALASLLALAQSGTARATQYDVGPSQPLAEIDEVPWESLQPGDTVRIHPRPTPYKSKWVIDRVGTEAQPIR